MIRPAGGEGGQTAAPAAPSPWQAATLNVMASMPTPGPTPAAAGPAASVRYTFRLLRAAEFWLDGGSMFGLVPRAVWSKMAPPDDRGRIPVQHNCLLLERAGPLSPPPSATGAGTPGGEGGLIEPRRVLIEVGTGNKLDAKMRDIFALQDRYIVDALREAGCEPESIEAVVVSHLHFDHAGALTRRPREEEMASLTEVQRAHNAVPTFPKAVIHSQQREWADALANRSVMTRTYYRDHLEPVAHQIKTVDSPRPFPTGYIPDRDELPALPLEYRLTPILPGISVFLVPGHTWGQQAVMFTDTQGRTVVFTPDVMPTVNHVGQAYSLGYDVEPYTSMVSRRWFLTEAARRDWVLCLDHEPGNPLQRVRENTKGWFDLVPA